MKLSTSHNKSLTSQGFVIMRVEAASNPTATPPDAPKETATQAAPPAKKAKRTYSTRSKTTKAAVQKEKKKTKKEKKQKKKNKIKIMDAEEE